MCVSYMVLGAMRNMSWKNRGNPEKFFFITKVTSMYIHVLIVYLTLFEKYQIKTTSVLNSFFNVKHSLIHSNLSLLSIVQISS